MAGKDEGVGSGDGASASAQRSIEGEKEGRVRPRPKEIREDGEVRRQEGPGSAGRSHSHALTHPLGGASGRATAPSLQHARTHARRPPSWPACRSATAALPNFPHANAKFMPPFIFFLPLHF